MTDEQKRKIDELRRDGCGYRQIARATGVSLNSIKSYCRRMDEDIGTDVLSVDRKMVPMTEGQCENCGAAITQTPGRRRKQFCSDRCRWQWWNDHQDQVNRKANYEFTCRHCGRSFVAYGNRNRRYCGRECYFAERYGGKDHGSAHQ